MDKIPENPEFTVFGFLKSVLKFSSSSWINFFVNIIAVVITTRIFDPDIFGIINVFNSTTSLVLGAVCLGLDSSYVRFYFEADSGKERQKLLNFCMGIPFLLLVILGTVTSLFFFGAFSSLIFEKVSRLLTIMVFINVLSALILRYFTITYRMNNNAKMFTVLSVLIQLFSRGFVILAALFDSENYVTVVSFNALGVAGLCLIFLVTSFRTLFPYRNEELKGLKIHNKRDVFTYAIYSWPILFIIYLNTLFSQLIIKGQMGYTELGIYTSTNIFVGALSACAAGFTSYWSAFMYGNYKSQQKRIIKIHNYILILVLLIMVFIVAFRDVIYLAIGEKYQDSKSLFALVLIYPILTLLSETTVYGNSIVKKTYIAFIAYFLSFGTNILLCYWLIPRMGLVGAAFASVVSALFMFYIQTFFAQKYYKSVGNIHKTNLVVLTLIVLAVLNFRLSTMYLCLIIIPVLILFMFVFRPEALELKELATKIIQASRDKRKKNRD